MSTFQQKKNQKLKTTRAKVTATGQTNKQRERQRERQTKRKTLRIII